MLGLSTRVPDAVQREAKRSGAPLIRDPGFLIESNRVPGLHCITSCCNAPGTRNPFHSLMSLICFARAVAAPSRNARSVPVET